MSRFDEVLQDERICRAGRPLRLTLRAYALGMALAGLVAGGMLLMPAVAGAAEVAKSEPAAAPGAAGPKKVSPYVAASRRQREAKMAAAEPSTKPPVGQPAKKKSVRPKRH